MGGPRDRGGGDDRPATRNLHLALVAKSREAGGRVVGGDDGRGASGRRRAGPRPQYSPSYYGAFVRDPDGNSLEAVHHGEPREGENRLDHLWIRVRDLTESRLFYETVAPTVGLRVHDGDERAASTSRAAAARSRSCRTSR